MLPGQTQPITLALTGIYPDAVRRLIDRFDQQSDPIRSPDYHETTLRIQFSNPLFAAGVRIVEVATQ